MKRTPAKKTAARRTKRTPEIIDEIITRLSKGEPLAQICRSSRMPSVVTIWNWEQEDKSLAERVARARLDGYDAIAAECLAIADDHEDDPASRRVRTDVRLKLLAKWDPRRYGDRLGLDNGQGGPLEIVIRKRYGDAED